LDAYLPKFLSLYKKEPKPKENKNLISICRDATEDSEVELNRNHDRILDDGPGRMGGGDRGEGEYESLGEIKTYKR
jgi:hypothetical protein